MEIKNILILIFGKPKSELRKFWYCISCTLLSLYFTGVTNVYNHKRGVIMTNNNECFNDVGFTLGNQIFNNKNDYEKYHLITEVTSVIFIIFNLLSCLVYNKGDRLKIIIRFCLMIMICFAIRSIVNISTVLPRPWLKNEEWPTCGSSEGYNWSNPFLEPLKLYFFSRTTCYDFFFSGHTIFLTTSTLLFTKYINNIISQIIVWFMLFVTLFLICITRAHYLIDIEAAFILSILLWKIYEYEMELKKGLFYYWFGPSIGSSLDEENNSEKIQEKRDTFERIRTLPEGYPTDLV